VESEYGGGGQDLYEYEGEAVCGPGCLFGEDVEVGGDGDGVEAGKCGVYGLIRPGNCKPIDSCMRRAPSM
jgi:hypothetical protein